MSVSDTLNLAADYLQVHGWAQGEFGEEGGPRCLVGALVSAEGIQSLCPVAEAAVQAYLGDQSDSPSVPDWNDAPGRTATEVVEVLRATALIEAARERQTAEVSA